jgi:hypothetical protein
MAPELDISPPHRRTASSVSRNQENNPNTWSHHAISCLHSVWLCAAVADRRRQVAAKLESCRSAIERIAQGHRRHDHHAGFMNCVVLCVCVCVCVSLCVRVVGVVRLVVVSNKAIAQIDRRSEMRCWRAKCSANSTPNWRATSSRCSTPYSYVNSSVDVFVIELNRTTISSTIVNR